MLQILPAWLLSIKEVDQEVAEETSALVEKQKEVEEDGVEDETNTRRTQMCTVPRHHVKSVSPREI